MNHELKHILRHHVQINLVVRGLTDRFCNHIEEKGVEESVKILLTKSFEKLLLAFN